FSINEELDQVVVKVIDSKTDKVIKEIPPEVLQRLYVRIREAIGLLIDEMI
ncbi:MAG: flagellar protein FlaG, partial [Spirochaetales bacterium]|nr:flagellar protein FlaG [Spirochaetales bacterium]